MAILRPLLASLLTLCLAACFVTHDEPIGAPEGVPPGEYAGLWVAQPLEPGGEPGFFLLADTEPSAGRFTVTEADPDGRVVGDPIELVLRRAGDTLFVEVRENAGEPWRMFVATSLEPARIELAWKPVAARFAAAFADNSLAGALGDGAPAGGIPDVALTEFDAARQSGFARDWQSYFTADRLVFRKSR